MGNHNVTQNPTTSTNSCTTSRIASTTGWLKKRNIWERHEKHKQHWTTKNQGSKLTLPKSVCYVFDLPTSSHTILSEEWSVQTYPNTSTITNKSSHVRHIYELGVSACIHTNEKETSPHIYISQQMIHLQPFKHHVSGALAILELDINLPRPWTFRPGATGDTWKSHSHHLRLH